MVGVRGEHRSPKSEVPQQMSKRALLPIVLALLLAGCNGGQNQPNAAPVGTLTGVITGPSGPVSGASISLSETDGSQRSGVSTADGYFEIDRVPAGTIQLSVNAAGFAPWQTNAVIAPNATTTQDVRLTPL